MEGKKTKLTIKQRSWLRAYMDYGQQSFGNATVSALLAYYPDFVVKAQYNDYTPEQLKTYNAAKNIGWENVTKLDINITDIMDEAGLSDVFLVGKLAENLEATRLYGKEGLEHGDYSARNKALEIGLKLKGKLSDKVDLDVKGGFFLTDKIKIITVDERAEIESETDSNTQITG